VSPAAEKGAMRHIRQGLLALLLTAALSLPTSAGFATSFTVDSTGDGDDTNTLDGVCNDGTGAARCGLPSRRPTRHPAPIRLPSIFLDPARTPSPLPRLPAVSDTLTIDGTTQAGFSGTPIVELRGDAAGANADVYICRRSTIW
jgi:hypothetical protein